MSQENQKKKKIWYIKTSNFGGLKQLHFIKFQNKKITKMSDFMKFEVESVKDSTVAVRVWFFAESYSIQHTIDWMFLSMSLSSEEIQELFDEFYFELQRAEDPEIEDDYLYCVDIQAETLPEVSSKLIKKMEIKEILNLHPSEDYYSGNTESFDDHLKISPQALYEVTFVEEKYAQAFEIGLSWTGPCFDLLDPAWVLEKDGKYIEVAFNPYRTLACYVKKFIEIIDTSNWYLTDYTKEDLSPTTYPEVLAYLEQLQTEGWNLLYCNHVGDPAKLKFKEN